LIKQKISIAPDSQNIYSHEDNSLRVRRSKIGGLLVIILTPLGIALDQLLYPELARDFYNIRIVAILLGTFLYGLHFTTFGKRHIIYLGMVWPILVNTYICTMIYMADGAFSPYYGVLNIVIFGFALLMPWVLSETLFLSIFTLILYLVASYANHSYVHPLETWNIFFTNFYFIGMTSIISTTSSYFIAQNRVSDFNLRQELDLRNKELEGVDKMKTQFFANISHELRTPLTLILSPIQDLLQSPLKLDDKIASLLITARNNSMRLLKLVNDILEITKLEEGKSNLALESIEINAFLAGTINSMTHMMEARNIQLVKEFSNDPLVIQADTYAMERVFLNLLGNAIKFTPEGGSITLRSTKNLEETVIEIADTGIGINEQDLPLIFDRFHQADGSSTRKYQGTGLGLALVKDLIEKMGGSISVNSKLGVGTTMRVVFPLSWEKHSEEEIHQMPTEGELLEVIHRSAEHIAALPIDTPFEKGEADLPPGDGPLLLIVDDEPDMRQHLVSALGSDYRIVQARNGRQGLELARQYLPELMILDYMLPGMDGLEVCKLLKDAAGTRHTKIMLLTARMDEETKITALDYGADDFLTKPFSKIEVQSRLHNLLETSNLELNLKKQNQELEKALLELKQTQVKLIHSEKLNSLGTLTAGLMHEINNPLNFTLTALKVAQRDPNIKDDEELQDLFNDIDEGMQRIRKIVSDLHTFAYPSEAEKTKPFLFSQAVESAMRFTANQHIDVSVKLIISDQDEVLGSQSHIVQILINLLNNAFAAVESVQDKRKGNVIIESKSTANSLRISISDNGVGISSDIRAQIFDPFFTTQDVGDGMGLGLSICHTILQNHNSTLSVESEEGEWTKFSFSLPLASANRDIKKHVSVN